MDSARAHLVTTVEEKNLPVLIIDKKGVVGASLAHKLKEQFLVVLVSGNALEFHKNIIHIPYRRKIPVIPDNTYSHIFVLYNGEEEVLAILPTLVKKANEASGKMIFLTSLAHGSSGLYKHLENHLYYSMKVILYGEVFDEDIRLPNMVNYFIYQARRQGRLEIPNEGLGKLYPVYLHDLLAVIIATAFAHETTKSILLAYPRTPFTEMSVARVFQKINPEIKIDFNRRKLRNPKYIFPTEGEYVFNSYNLEHGLKQISISSERGESTYRREKPKAPPAQKLKISVRALLLSILTVFVAPLVLALVAAVTGGIFLATALSQTEKGEFRSASYSAKNAKVSFTAAETLGVNYFPGDLLMPELKEEYVTQLRTGKKVSVIGEDLFSTLSILSGIFVDERDKKSDIDIYSAIASTKSSLLQLEELKAQNQLPDNVQKRLEEMSYMLTLFENTIEFLPELMGFEKPKKYLLLFQNNMELRPGGGFIGSYGIVNFDKGKMGKIQIHDVYDADGKLKTHIEPPYALRRYGGVSHWFLRDSNFDIDGTTNAAAAADILKRSTGESVDGVISIDTNFIKNLLAVMGPVEVADYKETVTADNFYMLTQKHAEDNFFPGSTQKKDFLRALLNSMLTKLSSGEERSYLQIVKALEKSLKEKHMILAFPDESIQKMMTASNLSGTLWDKRRREENSFSDFFGVVDANIGGNKGNYYLKRDVAQSVTVSDSGQLFGEATITYENTSKKDSKFGGDYKTYTRFILPSGADLRTVSVDGRRVEIIEAITNPTQYTSKSFVAPSALEIESTKVDGKEVVGFVVSVPYSSTKKVTISYVAPQAINTSSSVFSYNLRLFKQPGTDEDPYSLTLNYPNRFIPVGQGPEIINLGGKLSYETKLNEDKDIKIQFSKK